MQKLDEKYLGIKYDEDKDIYEFYLFPDKEVKLEARDLDISSILKRYIENDGPIPLDRKNIMMVDGEFYYGD